MCVTVREVLSFSASNAAILSLFLYGTDTLRLKISRNKIKASFRSYGFLCLTFQESLAEFRANPTVRSTIVSAFSKPTPVRLNSHANTFHRAPHGS